MENCLRRFLLACALISSSVSYAQLVEGSILDAQGLSLPGAAVVVLEAPGKGTAADVNGKFIISDLSPGSYTLEFSFMGFESQTRKVQLKAGETRRLEVRLKEASNQLDEIVVVGYGVQRRREMTGNVVKLDGKELNDMPAPSFEAAMQGKAAGVQISTSGGMAGAGSVVRVRGIASVGAGGDPLYIIDGVQINQDYFAGRSLGRGSAGGMNQNPLAFLNPDDIESVEILKDASATAIYGSRGANGVILITTKRGDSRRKGLRFSFSTTQGVSMPTRRPEMLGGQEWLNLYEEAWVNDGNTGTPQGLPAQLSWEEAQRNNTDWVDQMIRTGYKQFYDFGVEKSSEKYNFFAGISYDANQSYLMGDQYNRLSGRFNGDYRFNDKLNLSLSSNLVQAVYDRVDHAWGGGLGSAMSTALPIYPIYYDRDVYAPNPDMPGDSLLQHRRGDYWFEAGAGNNPVGLMNLKQWQNTEIRSVNNLRLNYSPAKNLTFSVNGSVDISNFREDIYEPVGGNSYIVEDPALGQGLAQHYPRRSNSYNVHATANYEFKLPENHSLSTMVGTEFVEQISRVRRNVRFDADSSILVTNQIFDAPGPVSENDLLSQFPFDSVQIENQIRFASVFGRLNYSYKKRYIGQVVLRSDGSSAFGPDNRYGFFPSVSGGWIMSDEKWLKLNKYINYAKLKASVGFIGNANIGQNEFFSRYGVRANAYNNQDIRFPVNAPNPGLKWETTEVFDVGLEFGLFEDRITGEAAYYRKNTRDVLMAVSLPRINGFENFVDNVGSVLNYGVELQLTSYNLTGEFRWKTDFNVAFNRNRIVDLGGYSEDAVAGGTNDTRIVPGESIGTFYMVEVDHIDRNTGNPVYRSPNGELTQVYDQANRVAVGKGIPDAIGGITNTFSYKNWTLSALMVFSIGADVYDHSGKYQNTAWPAFGNFWNHSPQIYDRWTQPGDEARFPRLTLDPRNFEGLEEDFWNTSLWVQDATYWRLRNLTLGYQLRRKDAEKLGMKSVNVAFIATNLLTFTRFQGLDPEVARDFDNITDRNMSLNTTYLTPPQEKSFSIRINANF